MTGCRTPVQNLHAHMDPGGFDFTAYGLPLISDPGIYTYKDDENRYRFKRAASHNCLTVNDRDTWEYRGSWKYGPQKEGFICEVQERPVLPALPPAMKIMLRHRRSAIWPSLVTAFS